MISTPKTGILFVVGLPIGNSEDLSPRARRILGEVDIVAAEDTRLFARFCLETQINVKKVLSYYDQNEEGSSKELIRFLKAGSAVALVADAGTPAISDPGYRLVSAAHQENIRVVPVPGPSSLTSALSISSIGGASHVFVGFLPKEENAILDILKKYQGLADKIIFFESPRRVKQTLELISNFSNPKVSVLREMTKTYEEHLHGSASSILEKVGERELLGEVVIVVDIRRVPQRSENEIRALIHQALARGEKNQSIISELKDEHWTRQVLYDLIETVKSEKKRD